MTSKRNIENNKKVTLPLAARNKFEELQRKMEIIFHDKSLLYNAFTHSSYVNEHRRKNFTDN